MPKKRHHFVPQFYLRAFTSSSPSAAPRQIHLYNLARERTIENASIKDQCYSHRLYGKTDVHEDNLSRIEGDASAVLRFIMVHHQLPVYGTIGHLVLMSFVSLQILRTTQHIYRTGTTFDLIRNNLLQYKVDEKRIKIDELQVNVERAAIMSLQSVPDLAASIDDLNLCLICAQDEQIFITSDNPVFRYNQYFEDIKGLGTIGGLYRGLQVFLPLSPKHLLVLYDSTVYKIGSRRTSVSLSVPDDDVDVLNGLQVISAEENIYFSDVGKKDYVSRLVRKMSRRRTLNPVRVEELFAEDSKNHSLLHSYEYRPNLKLRLSFMNILKKARQKPVDERLKADYRLRKSPPYLGFDNPSSSKQGAGVRAKRIYKKRDK